MRGVLWGRFIWQPCGSGFGASLFFFGWGAELWFSASEIVGLRLGV